MNVKRNDGTGPAGHAGRRETWPVKALLVVGAWLVISPLVLSTTRVTTSLVSAVVGGLAVAVLAGWALLARNRVPPLAIACFFGLWLVAAPSLWEFSDGVDSGPELVPIDPSNVMEPMRAVVARAEWNSVLTGLVVLLLAGSVLLAARRRQGRPAPTTDQLAALRRQHPRPRLQPNDRALRAALSRLLPGPDGQSSWSRPRRCLDGTAAWCADTRPTQRRGVAGHRSPSRCRL
jgi:hypothetical protein